MSWTLYGLTALLALSLGIGLSGSEQPAGEGPAWVQTIFGTLYVYVLLRLVAQVPIFAFERNAETAARTQQPPRWHDPAPQQAAPASPAYAPTPGQAVTGTETRAEE